MTENRNGSLDQELAEQHKRTMRKIGVNIVGFIFLKRASSRIAVNLAEAAVIKLAKSAK
jgi:hypothetical protein